MKGRIVAGCAAGVLALAAIIVKPWEGLEPDPYRDIVGVLTVCYGSTGSVENRRHSLAECDALLARDLSEAYGYVRRCITAPLKDHEAAAFTSLVFNVGPRGVCGSTLQRLANAGNVAGACAQLDRWVYAGGRKVRGLVNRRAAERRLCEGKA